MVNDWADAIDSATRGLTYAYAIAIGNKTYDGTNEVTIHVPHFGGLFYQDELYGDGIATVASPNTGTYSTCDWTNLQFGGADQDWYDMSGAVNVVGAYADITISKTYANASIIMPDEITESKEFQLEFTINNTFNNLEGLPTAEQISFSSDDATVLSVTKKDNVYTAIMMAQKDIDADEITVTLPSQILRKTTNRDLL